MQTIKVKTSGKVCIQFDSNELILELVADDKSVSIEPLYKTDTDSYTTLPFSVSKSVIVGNQILVTGLSIRLNREVDNKPPVDATSDKK